MGAPSSPSSWRPPRDHLPGLLGHYELLAPLGAGGMGVVWRAVSDQHPGAVLAIKFLLLPDGGGQLPALFRWEAERLLSINHQFLARAYAYLNLAEHARDGWPPAALVMRRYAGSLEGALRGAAWAGRRLPWRGMLRLAGNLAVALDALHDRHDLVHRDVKPANVLLDLPDGRYPEAGEELAEAEGVLADLGVAGEKGRPGLRLGQDGWKAPELFDGERPKAEQVADPAEDVYGFGKILAVLAEALDPDDGPREQLCARARACFTPNPKARPPSSELLNLLLSLNWNPDRRRSLLAPRLAEYPNLPRPDLAPDPVLIAACCRLTDNNYHRAAAAVREADALLRESDPGTPAFDLALLPSGFNESAVFWRAAFLMALRELGGRAGAALLLGLDEAQLGPSERAARGKLLAELRKESAAFSPLSQRSPL